MQRGKIGQAAIDTLDKYGLIDDLPESAQINLFDMLAECKDEEDEDM